MKRITALILLAAILLSLAACGGQQPSGGSADSPPETVSPDAPASEPPEEPAAETADDTGTETDDETGAETREETSGPETAPEPIMGVYDPDSNTYVNELIGLGCRLDEDWYVYDADEIASLNGMMADMMTDETIAEQLESSGYVQPFYAQLGDDPVTVNITVENLGLLYGALLDEQQYIELTIDQLPSVLESIGLTDITSEITSTTFMGSEHTAVNITGQMQGAAFYETMVCVKVDRYMACVTAASYLADVTGEILDMFYSL